MRLLRRLLRWLKPIWVLPPRSRPLFALVSRHLDVVEVSRRTQDFSVALYDDKMKATTGPFFLGFGPTQQYEREVGIVRRALRDDDLPRIRTFLRQEARRLVERATASGNEIDVVTQLANILPVQLVDYYYGIPAAGDDRLLRWFQNTSHYIFWPLTLPRVRMAAVRAGTEVRIHVLKAIAARRTLLHSTAAPPDDLLGRLLQLQTDQTQDHLDDDGVVRTLAGLASGTIIPTTGIFVTAVEHLMRLPVRERQTLHDAACEGNDETIAHYLLEAERFHPYPPFVYRYCERESVLAKGSSRQTTIPEGTTVVSFLVSAAEDGEVIDAPGEFRPGRPRWQYPQFGHGQHQCLGADLSVLIATEMAKPLFALKGLRRFHGRRGRVQTTKILDGGYATHFVLAFDPQ